MKYAIFVLSLSMALPAGLMGQQHNLQMLVPPAVSVYGQKGGDIAFAAARLHGPRVNVDGIDFNTVYVDRRSSSTWRSFTAGAALLGALGKDTFLLGGVKKNVVGMSLHMTGSRHYLRGGGEYPRWTLLAGVAASFGKYSICRGTKEEGSFYNLLVGPQGGVTLNYRAGDFAVAPSLTAGLMGGYSEKYKGGEYWSNMSSGGVSPFAVLTAALDLAYLPREVKLATAYQRYFSNGKERAMDSLTFQFSIGWGGLHPNSNTTPAKTAV